MKHRSLGSGCASWGGHLGVPAFSAFMAFGAALALKTRQHFVIEFVIDRIPGTAGALMRVLVAGLVVLATLIVFGTGLIYMSWGWNAVTPATEISVMIERNVRPR